MAVRAKYSITVRVRSGREYSSRPIELTDAQSEQIYARMRARNDTLDHALASVVHEVLSVAVRGEELITLGSGREWAGNIAVSGREVEAISVEVAQ